MKVPKEGSWGFMGVFKIPMKKCNKKYV